MKQGDFINLATEAYRIPFGQMRLFVRELRKEGLLTKGAHGVNAPDMTPLDAARLTIAVLGTDKPTHAGKVVRAFGDLAINYEFTVGSVPEFARDAQYAVSLEEALVELFSFKGQWQSTLRYVEICSEENEAKFQFSHGEALFDADFATHQTIYETETNKGRQTIRRLKYGDLAELAVALHRDPLKTEGNSS